MVVSADPSIYWKISTHDGMGSTFEQVDDAGAHNLYYSFQPGLLLRLARKLQVDGERQADLVNLAKLLRCFRAPIYVCSASAERWEISSDFDDAVLMVHSILVDFPNIIICRGGRNLDRFEAIL